MESELLLLLFWCYLAEQFFVPGPITSQPCCMEIGLREKLTRFLLLGESGLFFFSKFKMNLAER